MQPHAASSTSRRGMWRRNRTDADVLRSLSNPNRIRVQSRWTPFQETRVTRETDDGASGAKGEGTKEGVSSPRWFGLARRHEARCASQRTHDACDGGSTRPRRWRRSSETSRRRANPTVEIRRTWAKLGVGRRRLEDRWSSTCTVECDHVRDSDRSSGTTWTSTPRTKPRARVRHLVPRRRPSFRRLLFHPSRRPLFLSHPPFRLVFASSRLRPTRGRICSVRTDAFVRRTAPRSVCTIRHRSWPWTCGSRAIFVSVPGPTWRENSPIQPPKTAIPTILASPMLTKKTTVHAVHGGPGRSLRPDAPSDVPVHVLFGSRFPSPDPTVLLPPPLPHSNPSPRRIPSSAPHVLFRSHLPSFLCPFSFDLSIPRGPSNPLPRPAGAGRVRDVRRTTSSRRRGGRRCAHVRVSRRHGSCQGGFGSGRIGRKRRGRTWRDGGGDASQKRVETIRSESVGRGERKTWCKDVAMA